MRKPRKLTTYPEPRPSPTPAAPAGSGWLTTDDVLAVVKDWAELRELVEDCTCADDFGRCWYHLDRGEQGRERLASFAAKLSARIAAYMAPAIAAREAAERIANDPEPDLNGPPHAHDPHGVPWRERALVRGNVLRYIAFATTGDENGDAQLGVDNLKAALAASTEREARLLKAINWAVGCGDADDFPTSEPGKRYNWRPGLASRAGLVYDKEAGRYVLAAPEGGAR